MRRWLALLLVLVLAVQSVGAVARTLGHCCDEACPDLAMCATLACKNCPAPAAVAPVAAIVLTPPSQPVPPFEAAALPTHPRDIWRPPQATSI